MLGKIAEGFLCYTQKTLKGGGFTWTNNKMSEVSGAVQKAWWWYGGKYHCPNQYVWNKTDWWIGKHSTPMSTLGSKKWGKRHFTKDSKWPQVVIKQVSGHGWLQNSVLLTPHSTLFFYHSKFFLNLLARHKYSFFVGIFFLSTSTLDIPRIGAQSEPYLWPTLQPEAMLDPQPIEWGQELNPDPHRDKSLTCWSIMGTPHVGIFVLSHILKRRGK